MACVRSSQSCAASIPDLHLEIQDTATSGDTTWFRIRATGTNDGPMWGRPATGRPIDITVMDVMRVADGRMVEHWGVADRLAVLKQIGAMGGGGRSPVDARKQGELDRGVARVPGLLRGSGSALQRPSVWRST